MCVNILQVSYFVNWLKLYLDAVSLKQTQRCRLRNGFLINSLTTALGVVQ